ncbi:lecithin retinol acyltransferase family protein [Romboutsia ilealis]|uniref:lecithin retinol acyltransferase family protein n=1 Tax=Romboutsia ilealis TaxID=1115758 RepID=UPI002572F6FB|nr:lecithin retinol acyltransferase family protein [Romboutsia ilealis]
MGILELLEDIGDVLADAIEDSCEVFEKRVDEKFADISNKIDRIEESDSMIDKINYTLTSSRTLRSKKRKEEFDKKERAEVGDIIGVLRSFYGVVYEHYGIYIGDGEVIHFTKSDGKNTIIKTSMKKFMESNKSSNRYFILDCEPEIKDINSSSIDKYIKKSVNGFGPSLPAVFRKPVEIYSPEDTVNRAKQYIGEQGYNLLVKNCEHFAIWCKTGLKYSYQIDMICVPNNKKWIDYCN